MQLCIYVYVYKIVFLTTYVHIYIYVDMHMYIYSISIYLSIYLSLCVCVGWCSEKGAEAAHRQWHSHSDGLCGGPSIQIILDYGNYGIFLIMGNESLVGLPNAFPLGA